MIIYNSLNYAKLSIFDRETQLHFPQQRENGDLINKCKQKKKKELLEEKANSIKEVKNKIKETSKTNLIESIILKDLIFPKKMK